MRNCQSVPGGHRSSRGFFRFSLGGRFPRGWMSRCRCRCRLSFLHRFGRRCGRRFVLLFNPRNLVVLAGLPRHRCRHFSHLHLHATERIHLIGTAGKGGGDWIFGIAFSSNLFEYSIISPPSFPSSPPPLPFSFLLCETCVRINYSLVISWLASRDTFMLTACASARMCMR